MKELVLGLALCALLASPPSQAAGGGEDASSSEAPADPDFKAGVQAVKKQAWPEVVARMGAVVRRNARNADAWNYLGYAYRHLGDMDKSFSHYERALQIDPDHRGAREYLGEAYLQVGKVAEAEAQLRALDKICWLPCEEFRDLEAKLAQYRKNHPG
ncbi:MAG: tetratricopeptide repeat protein [Burkholderiales bacterium]|nr:tetratricopeptide repeat protein [Burkholderiales bacterium]